MLEASRQLIIEMLDEDALVLDVGGGALPFERADWVIDLLRYDERAAHADYAAHGDYDRPGDDRERFDASTWVTRDICDHRPWPFSDRKFDVAICSHTLEDVRDPIWVCHELNRVARAGYIEFPSRLEEQSYGFQGAWAGWGHHRWFIDIDPPDGLQFVFKHHIVHGRDSDHFDLDFYRRLSPEQRNQAFWWRDSFRYRERIIMSADEIDSYLADFVIANSSRSRSAPRRLMRRLRRTSRRVRRRPSS